MRNAESSYDEGDRYLKRFEVVETKSKLPIQGQVKSPEDLSKFLHDLKRDHTPQIVGVYLDANNFFLGHQVFLGATSKTFNTQLIYLYHSLFLATKYILLLNHPSSGDPTPDEDDRRLMRVLQVDAQVISFQPHFEDFVVVGRKSYFSMATNDGTGCRCGHQEYMNS